VKSLTSSAEKPGFPAEISSPESKGLNVIHVLIVDDIQENLDLLEYRLVKHGYRIIRASNGWEALERMRRYTIDLIISDAMMPTMDGFQFCKEVRANPEYTRIPFILYSSNYLDDEDIAFAQHLGVTQYVVKSGFDAILDVVHEVLQPLRGEQMEIDYSGEAKIDDVAFLKKHHTIVIRKLEEKMAELKMYSDVLTQKNRDLQSSEMHYRGLFEHASIPIFLLDGQTRRVMDANREGLALIGYTKDEIHQLQEFPFVTVKTANEAVNKFEVFTSGEKLLRTKSGKVLVVEVHVGEPALAHERRFLLYVRDTTEEKKMKQQLMHMEKMSLMGRLAGGIAHEIRNPLSSVMMNLQFLLQNSEISPTVREFVAAATEGANRINQVVENTLNLARGSPLHLQEENLNQILQSALWFMKVPAQRKNVALDAHLAESLAPTSLDARQIQQVIINLMQNAIDASPEGGNITITTGMLENIADNAEFVSNKIVLSIRDNGPGIPQEQLKYIFEPFQTTKAGGTGLGLALSKHIMDQHNAELAIEPTLGGGTIARLIFPVTQQKEAANVKRKNISNR
jgi:PAS domain S-box-containing protein